MLCGSGAVSCSSSLLIRRHQRARCQAEIPLTAPSEIVEPPLWARRKEISNMETEPLKTNEKKVGDLLGFDLIACEKKINNVLLLAYEVRNEFSNAGFENG